MSNNDISKRVSLGLELQTSIKLLQVGLCELQKINGANDFYSLPFQLLSSGFERLMKCIICFKWYDNKGCFPTVSELKTHDLMLLKSKIISDCISEEIMNKRIATKEDYNLILNDKELDKLLYVLSEFGKYSRYYNLDIVTGNKKPSTDVEGIWEKYELNLINQYPNLKKLFNDNSKIDELYREINKKIISKLERFTRALVRLFTLGGLGNEAETHTGIISPFLFLMDDDLGETDYTQNR